MAFLCPTLLISLWLLQISARYSIYAQENITEACFDGRTKENPEWKDYKLHSSYAKKSSKAAAENRGAEKDVKFYLFNNVNPSGKQIYQSGESLEKAGWKSTPTTELKVLVHGFTENLRTSHLPQGLARVYLKSKPGVNVIGVDWGVLAAGPNYFAAAGYTEDCGNAIGLFLEFLSQHGLNYKKVHLIGFSLGAHASGFAGAYLKSKGTTIARITGLDPAGPGFFETSGRLDKGDAEFVDVIHTNMGNLNPIDKGVSLGTGLVSGHVDFYPNGGEKQSGCFIDPFGHCSHLKAVEYFTKSVEDKGAYKACPCESWENFKGGRCRCSELVPMGEYCSTSTRGKYFLNI